MKEITQIALAALVIISMMASAAIIIDNPNTHEAKGQTVMWLLCFALIIAKVIW